MEAVGTVKTKNGKITCETAEGSVINISITQRSALDCMLDTIHSYRLKTPNTDTKPARGVGSTQSLGLGVSFVTVGFFCVMLAVILVIVRPWLIILYSGTHFWVGFPFMVCGVLHVVSSRYPNPFWLVVASVALMVCLGVSIAGLIHTTRDISQFSWSHSECDDITYSRSPPTYEDRNNDHLSTCKRVLTNYKKMQFGLLIMSLLIMIWGICSSAMFLGYRLYLVFTASKCEKPQEEDDDEPLLSPNP